MSRYRWPSFRPLVRDFFADLRELISELKRREGQAAFLLLLVTLATSALLFFIVLGFDGLSDLSLVSSQWHPLQCRTPDNMHSLFIVIGGVVFVLLAVLTLGEAMLFVDRKRRGQPGKVRALLVPTAMMLGVGAFGAVGMRLWC